MALDAILEKTPGTKNCSYQFFEKRQQHQTFTKLREQRRQIQCKKRLSQMNSQITNLARQDRPILSNSVQSQIMNIIDRTLNYCKTQNPVDFDSDSDPEI